MYQKKWYKVKKAKRLILQTFKERLLQINQVFYAIYRGLFVRTQDSTARNWFERKRSVFQM